MAASDLPNALKLETEEQKKALAGLSPNSGIAVEKLHNLVLNLLWMISNAENIYSRQRPSRIARRQYSVSPAKIRHLRKSARLARKMADQLKKDSENLREKWKQFGLVVQNLAVLLTTAQPSLDQFQFFQQLAPSTIGCRIALDDQVQFSLSPGLWQ